MNKPIISADSHIAEPPNCYVDRIDKKWKDRAPHMVKVEGVGDVFVVDGMDAKIPLGLVAAAGKDPQELRAMRDGVPFDEVYPSAWDSSYRLADQERDGIFAEVIYPSVGMFLCNHPDFDYKKACFDAYNLWIAEYCDPYPDRLFALGQTAMRSPDEGIKDLEKMKAMGMKGVMLPGNPKIEDYDSPIYDEFWQAAIDLGLPPSFHILTSAQDGLGQGGTRGPRLNGFLSIIRGCQDIMGMLVLSGVFERNPNLKVACVEADAGWVPHYMYRMDHAFKRHRHWLTAGTLSKLPSEYFRENIYVTFQDDWVAFQMKDMCNFERVMWANDFPHSDSTWPWSQDVLKEHASHLSQKERDLVLHDNVSEFYNLDVH
jgi:predicted TIM-barrel fold metal-dependent hydrolase